MIGSSRSVLIWQPCLDFGQSAAETNGSQLEQAAI